MSDWILDGIGYSRPILRGMFNKGVWLP